MNEASLRRPALLSLGGEVQYLAFQCHKGWGFLVGHYSQRRLFRDLTDIDMSVEGQTRVRVRLFKKD